jgi:RND family efflux transporter MFP subunit
MQTRAQRHSGVGAAALLFAVAGAVVVPYLATGAAAPTAPPAAAALPVDTAPVVPLDGFERPFVFSGLVQPRRDSPLGFESAGRLARVYVDEGETVEPGAVLAELDTARLRAQRAELTAARAEAEANLALAAATLARLRSVVEAGGVSRQGLDEAREGHRAAQAALQLVGQRIASVDVELAKSRLYAPFAGSVVARLADEGRVLDGGTPVLRLQERVAPEVRIGVAGPAVEQLVPGETYPLTWRGRTLAARLRALLPLRAVAVRTVDALFEPIDVPPALLPGDVVTLRLANRVEEPGSWLPLTALTEGERGLWSVYVAEPASDLPGETGATHRVVRRTVDLIHQDGERVFVRGALAAHDRVVTTGMQRIVPGQGVRALDERVARRD